MKIAALTALCGLLVSALPAVAQVAQSPAPSASPAASTAPASPSVTVAVVPFEEPSGEAVDALAASDHALVTALQARNVTATAIDAVAHLDLPHKAAAICKQTGAQAIVVGSLRTEQSFKLTYAVLTNIPHYPTHAELRLSTLDCAGRVTWRTVAIGDKDYYWSNVGAAVAETSTMAIQQAVTDFPLPLAATPLPLATIAPSATLATTVVIPGANLAARTASSTRRRTAS